MDQTTRSRNGKTSSVMVDDFEWIKQQVVGILIYESEVDIAKERASQVKEVSSITEKIIATKQRKSSTDLELELEISDFNEKFKSLEIREINLAKFRSRLSTTTDNTHQDFEAALKETKKAIKVQVDKEYMIQSSMVLEFKRLESKLKSILLRIRIRSSNEEGGYNEDLCAICLKDMVGGDDTDDKDDLKETCCGHVYHSSCLKTWLEKNYTCPLCRYEISVRRQITNSKFFWSTQTFR